MNRIRSLPRTGKRLCLALSLAVLLASIRAAPGAAVEVTPLTPPAVSADSPRHAPPGWGAIPPSRPVYASGAAEFADQPVVGHGNLVSKEIWARYGRRPNVIGSGAAPAAPGNTGPAGRTVLPRQPASVVAPGTAPSASRTPRRYVAPGPAVSPAPSGGVKPAPARRPAAPSAAVSSPDVVRNALHSAPATPPAFGTPFVAPQAAKAPTPATPPLKPAPAAVRTGAATRDKTASSPAPPSADRQQSPESISASWIIHRPASADQRTATAPAASAPEGKKPYHAPSAPSLTPDSANHAGLSADTASSPLPPAAAAQAPKNISASWLIPPAQKSKQGAENAAPASSGPPEASPNPYHAPPSPPLAPASTSGREAVVVSPPPGHLPAGPETAGAGTAR